jgi:hypothetical protein
MQHAIIRKLLLLPVSQRSSCRGDTFLLRSLLSSWTPLALSTKQISGCQTTALPDYPFNMAASGAGFATRIIHVGSVRNFWCRFRYRPSLSPRSALLHRIADHSRISCRSLTLSRGPYACRSHWQRRSLNLRLVKHLEKTPS